MTDHKYKNQHLWNNITKSLGLEPREVTVIKGASGLTHQLLALGVDDKDKRLLLVSADADPRVTAMMQADVQATVQDIRVLVVRPTVVDLGILAQRFTSHFGITSVSLNDIKDLAGFRQKLVGSDIYKGFVGLDDNSKKEIIEKHLGEILAPIGRGYKHAALPTLAQISVAIQQAAYMDWKTIFFEFYKNNFDESTKTLCLKSFPELEATKVDREYGTCPIPLYEFTDDDWELFSLGKNSEGITLRLQQLGIYQYFYPSADHLALGLIDRGIITPKTIEASVSSAPSIGHPFGHSELLGENGVMQSLVNDLGDRGYLVEGEAGIEITPDGVKARASVKFRPREGIVSKLINRLNLSASISPKDFIP